ncbi:MAG: hypothetical protein WBQ24_04130 [Xanthobacteraceae bacterium]
MSNHYEHTQPGTLMIVISVVAALVCAAFAYSDTSVSRWIAGAIALGMIILAFLFSSLTVIVNDQDVRWYFGPGAWSYSTARSDIESAQAVRNSWTNGWGIRVGSGFRLYNVSGLNAVELKLKSGEIRRIGTDDPTRLAAALQER